MEKVYILTQKTKTTDGVWLYPGQRTLRFINNRYVDVKTGKTIRPDYNRLIKPLEKTTDKPDKPTMGDSAPSGSTTTVTTTEKAKSFFQKHKTKVIIAGVAILGIGIFLYRRNKKK
jgi:LPXTG-motif cell wall-anchored protein